MQKVSGVVELIPGFVGPTGFELWFSGYSYSVLCIWRMV